MALAAHPALGGGGRTRELPLALLPERAPLLELTGPDPATGDPTATGIWAMEDRLWWSVDGRERRLHGWGHYHERYRKVDGQWLIAYRRLERIRVDTGWS